MVGDNLSPPPLPNKFNLATTVFRHILVSYEVQINYPLYLEIKRRHENNYMVTCIVTVLD